VRYLILSKLVLAHLFLNGSFQIAGQLSMAPTRNATSDSTAKNHNPTLSEVQSLIDKGEPATALKLIDSMDRQQPRPKGIERLRGMAYYLTGHFLEADAAFQRALVQDPQDRESLQLRGVTFFRMGKPADAIPLLERSHDNLTALNLDGRYVLALCYLNEHRFDESRRYFAELYRLQPDSAASYLLLARMLLRWKNSPAAEEMAQKALSLNAKLPEARLLLGQVALSEGKLDEALAAFEREVALNPMYGPVYDRLGDVYLQKNQFGRAQEALNQALILEPDATGPYILLGQTLLKQNNAATAVTFLKRAEQMDPANELTHFFLGQAYRDLGKKQDATKEFQIFKTIKNSTKPEPSAR